jgi:ABC-type multidrug transport system fused ATPase/permease subunit
MPAIDENLRYYLLIYIAISLTTSILGTIKFFSIFVGSIRASKNLFDGLTFTVLRTPLRWVDTVPLGRILNRFTADFNIIDSRLAMDIGFSTSSVFQLITVMVAGLATLLSQASFLRLIRIGSLFHHISLFWPFYWQVSVYA